MWRNSNVKDSRQSQVDPRACHRGLPGDLNRSDHGSQRASSRGTPHAGWLMVVTAVFVASMIGAAPAQQSVRDLVEIEGASPNLLKGAGVAYGLNGNGDSPKGETITTLKNILGNEFGRVVGDINSRNVALVLVTAVLPPFQKAGTSIDVHVAAIGDAKSLAGGTLFQTPLRSPRARGEDQKTFALAQGHIVVEGDAATGNPTAGVVSGGGLMELEIVQEFVFKRAWALWTPKKSPKDVWSGNVNDFGPAISLRSPTFILNLKTPDLRTANLIADSINTTIRNDKKIAGISGEYIVRNPMARALDGGRVEVRIPTITEVSMLGKQAAPRLKKDEDEEPKAGAPWAWYHGYDVQPARFLDEILSKVTVGAPPAKARVIINDSTKTIAIVGNVMVKRGAVYYDGPDPVNIPEDMPLTELLMQATNLGMTAQVRINVIRALHRAGLIVGEVKSGP